MNFRLFIVFLIASILTIGESKAQYKVKKYNAIVKTLNNKRIKGLFESVGENTITVRYHRKSKVVSADSISSIRIKRYNAQNKNFLLGGMLGLAGGLTAYKIQNDKGNVGPIILPVVVISSTVVGAAAFATINSLTSVDKFTNVSQKGNFTEIRESLKKYSLSR